MRSDRVVCKTVQVDLGDFDDVELMVIADLHIGDPTFDEKMLKAVAKWVNDADNRYVVIAGDIFNAGLKDSVSSVYNESMTLQQALDYFRSDVVDVLGAGNIVAVIRGNHDNRVVKSVGLDPVAVACELNGLTYCGAEGYITLSVGDWGRGKKRSPVKYLMFLTHGTGGGRTVGSKVNALMRHSDIVVADIYVQGHTHQPLVVPDVIYVPDTRRERIVERDQLFVNAASFIKRDSYAKDFSFAPQSRKHPVIMLSGREKSLEGIIKEIQ